MIAASDPQEFVPRGRQQASLHPGPLEQTLNQSKSQKSDVDEYVVSKFEQVSLRTTATSSKLNEPEWWLLRKTNETAIINASDDTKNNESIYSISSYNVPNSRRNSNESDKSLNSTSTKTFYPKLNSNLFETNLEPNLEDELYVKGHTVVWSRGIVNSLPNNDNDRKVICCYTTPSPIKHVLWCTFYRERPVFDPNLIEVHQNNRGTPVPAICVIDTYNIRVFTTKGEDFVIAIPFQIGKVWNTKFGIFIEKQMDCNVKEGFFENQSTLYSLAFPLDDICPLAIYYQSSNSTSMIQLLNNPNLEVVFTCENPSICMVYDSVVKQHSVYRIRKLKHSEKDFGEKLAASTSASKLKNRLSIWDNLISGNLNIPNSVINKTGSNMQQSRSASSMAAISRCQSPAASFDGSPWLMQSTPFNSITPLPDKFSPPVTNRSFFDSSKSMSHLRSNPTICLDYLWTDKGNSSAIAASKVFLSDDLAGQWYLCYILSSRQQLSIVRIDLSNISFGVLTSISAKDAVPIPQLHMLAILEHSGNVSLYSGLTLVGKLHIGGTLAQHTPSPYVRRYQSYFTNSPFPRRSSLLPHCKQSDPKFDEHLLSPVLPSASGRCSNILQIMPTDLDQKAILTGLVDPVDNRISLKYSDGSYYRIALPTLAESPLVKSCLKALQQCLNRDATLTFFSRWYSTRNVLGTKDTTAEQEWNIFTQLLFELLGYEEENHSEITGTPSTQKRKRKTTKASDDDWLYMTSTNYAQTTSDELSRLLKIDVFSHIPKKTDDKIVTVNPKSILFPSIYYIHYVLHLVYEDFKLDLFRNKEALNLMKLLNKLSNDLGLSCYSEHYWKDFPMHAIIVDSNSRLIPKTHLENLTVADEMCGKSGVVNIFKYIESLLNGENIVELYPYIRDVNQRSRDIIQLVGMLVGLDPNSEEMDCDREPPWEKFVMTMVEMQIDRFYLDSLPCAIYLLICSALWRCRENPPSNWPAEAYYLIWRDDLAAQVKNTENDPSTPFTDISIKKFSATNKNQVEDADLFVSSEIDGMEDIENPVMKLRFADDIRVQETRSMLQSSKPVPIVLEQRADVSDHDFIEEQEKHLYAICTRTMALPVGRGMLTLRTAMPLITEPFPTPTLCLTGKAAPRGSTVELTHIDTPANMNLWPLFHNGAANGLRISTDAQNIDDTWITFNKPKGVNVDQQMEHAGFIMALGLSGHLRNMTVFSRYDYLMNCHEIISVGVLVGLAAAFRGTSHMGLTKMLSVHLEAFLPPTSMELNVPQNLQVAALFGMGLLYQGTAHRHTTEVLLSEIDRPPGPEMENSVDRESYSLAAGLALGLVTLRHGDRPAGLSDLNVPDILHYYMVGGNKRPLTGSQKDKYRVPSFQIREGSMVNLDMTAPGATLALGLMYLGTGNKAIADWMAPPETQYLLDFVRPDFLMLRTLARNLILWNDIEPSKDWIDSQIPDTIGPYCMVQPNPVLDVDYEAMNQVYCNIVTGACFALGLRFAGTANNEAFETLLYFCKKFTSLTGKSIAELAGKPTIETCLNVVLLSTAMVMAGTGDLDVIRLVRHLRKRVGMASTAVVTYGSHLAMHMALGLLFLGGGRYTLSNSPQSVAALICAFYPKFPIHSNDNRYHLQAFRHLYVLAVDLRLIIPKDVNLNRICYANLTIIKIDGKKVHVRGPGIIPDLNCIAKVMVEDKRYWPVVFERGRNWDLLTKILSANGYIVVKQRAGCLSYIDDKFGHHSEIARTLTESEMVPWDPSPDSITSFTSDPAVKQFCDHFLVPDDSVEIPESESELRKMYTRITYEAVIKDKLIIIPVFMSLVQIVRDLDRGGRSQDVWQVKLLVTQVVRRGLSNLLSKETVLALFQMMNKCFDRWENEIGEELRAYLSGQCCGNGKVATYVTFFDIPFNCGLSKLSYFDAVTLLNEKKLTFETIERVLRILEISL